MTRRNRDSGQASVVLVGALVICLGFTGLAVDGARLFTARRDLQNVADSAALAGASAIDVGHFRATGGSEVRLDPIAARPRWNDCFSLRACRSRQRSTWRSSRTASSCT